MRAIDTNVLVRLLTRDDTRQTAAAEAFVARGAWVSHLVLAETLWVLDSVYEISRQEVAKGVEMLLGHRDVTLEDPDVVSAALERFRRASGIGFSDCLVLEIAKKAGHSPLGTFDKSLSREDGAIQL